MAARVAAPDAEVRFDSPHLLFEGGFMYDSADLVLHYFDVALDGRFLMLEPTEGRTVSLIVVQHWDEQLRTHSAQ